MQRIMGKTFLTLTKVKVKCQILYFHVNAYPLKALCVATPYFAVVYISHFV